MERIKPPAVIIIELIKMNTDRDLLALYQIEYR